MQKMATAKILMLHGHAESGSIFRSKTHRLEANLQIAFPPAPSPNSHPDYPGGIELFYPTGPLQLLPADTGSECGDLVSSSGQVKDKSDMNAWAWGNGDFRKADEIYGLAQSVVRMLEFIQQHGPFVGVIGFSCGAALSAILASLLEGGRSVDGFIFPKNFTNPPLRFAVCYSGFLLTSPSYKPCYYRKIRTPIFHMIGEYDPMTEEPQTLALARRCANTVLVKHPGAHYVPTKGYFLQKVVDFISINMSYKMAVDDSDELDWEDVSEDLDWEEV